MVCPFYPTFVPKLNPSEIIIVLCWGTHGGAEGKGAVREILRFYGVGIWHKYSCLSGATSFHYTQLDDTLLPTFKLTHKQALKRLVS